jgi:ABC-type transport system substrate-binding protein
MVPREIISEEILEGLGEPASTHWPKVSIGWNADLEPYEYSIDMALQHMKDAGFDVTIDTNGTGIGLFVVISILGLVGAIQIFFIKKRK